MVQKIKNILEAEQYPFGDVNEVVEIVHSDLLQKQFVKMSTQNAELQQSVKSLIYLI